MRVDSLLARIFMRRVNTFRLRIGRYFPRLSRKVKVGNWLLRGPVDHQLDFYMTKHRYYDFFLPALCRVMQDSGIGGPIVDVGANIGDTVALIRQAGVRNSIVAVEASSLFFGLLSHNAHQLVDRFGDVRLLNAFIGMARDNLVLEYAHGTAGTRKGNKTDVVGTVPVMTLSDLGLPSLALLKIDTDGYDGEIIEANCDYLKHHRPLIWAEMFVDCEDAVQSWNRALDELSGDYRGFMLFDNFGVLMFYGELNANAVGYIISLVKYSWTQRALESNGAGTVSIHYYDVALFPDVDANGVWGKFLDLVNSEMVKQGGVAL